MAKYDFIIVGIEERLEAKDFGERTRMFCKALSKSNLTSSILIVCSPVFFPNRFKKGSLKRKYKVIKRSLLYTLYNVENNTHLLTFNSLFPERDNIFSDINKFLFNQIFKHKVRESTFNLWLAKPIVSYLVKNSGYNKLYFDAIDNFLVHPQHTDKRTQLVKSYNWIEKNANKIIIASSNQYNQFKKIKADNIYLMHNGVDSIFFENNEKKDLQLEGPIIGYAGSLQDRIDIDLVEAICKKISNINIIFIGPNMNKEYFSPLYKYPNVHFTGTVPFNEIPAYIKSFDIGIIPHKINEFTESMNPLKIYEYLACGISVITTPISGSEEFIDYIDICDKNEDFISAIRKRLASPRNEARLLNHAKQHSWADRIKQINNDLLLTKI